MAHQSANINGAITVRNTMAPKFMTQYNQFQRTSYRYSKSRSLQKEVAEEKLFCFFPDRSAAKYAAKFLINLTHGIQ